MKKLITLSIIISLGVLANGLWNSYKIQKGSDLSLNNQDLRLDEINEHYVAGSAPVKASVVLTAKPAKKAVAKIQAQIASVVSSVEAQEVELAPVVTQDVTMQLVEYFNPNDIGGVKFEDKVSGEIEFANGAIASMNVTLEDGKTISFGSEKLNGNMFSYTVGNAEYRGMVYPVDATSYMLNLSEGPYAGVRIKFQDKSQVSQTSDLSYQTAQVEVESESEAGMPSFKF